MPSNGSARMLEMITRFEKERATKTQELHRQSTQGNKVKATKTRFDVRARKPVPQKSSIINGVVKSPTETGETETRKKLDLARVRIPCEYKAGVSDMDRDALDPAKKSVRKPSPPQCSGNGIPKSSSSAGIAQVVKPGMVKIVQVRRQSDPESRQPIPRQPHLPSPAKFAINQERFRAKLSEEEKRLSQSLSPKDLKMDDAFTDQDFSQGWVAEPQFTSSPSMSLHDDHSPFKRPGAPGPYSRRQEDSEGHSGSSYRNPDPCSYDSADEDSSDTSFVSANDVVSLTSSVVIMDSVLGRVMTL